MTINQNGRKINLHPGWVWDEETQAPMPRRLKKAKDQSRKRIEKLTQTLADEIREIAKTNPLRARDFVSRAEEALEGVRNLQAEYDQETRAS